MNDKFDITVVGAGLTGALIAIMMARRGFSVEVIEKRPDMRKHDISAGRSINLALAERGIEALRRVGLYDEVSRYTIAMHGRQIHDLDGAQNHQPYGQAAHEIVYSVHRGLLNKTLLNAAEKAGVQLTFDQSIHSVDLEQQVLHLGDSDVDGQHAFNVLIGADGAGSRIRAAMASYRGFDVHEDLLDHGYKELHTPPDSSGEFRMEANALHIWPRGGFMMIALPNSDGSFTNTLFLANKGEPSFESIAANNNPASFLTDQFGDAVALIPDFAEQYEANPVGLLGTVRCPQWNDGGRAVLIGDAAHAIVPFHGQGMNCGFEDCTTLDLLVDAIGPHWPQVFDEFEMMRKPNADAIATMALENYIEMRSDVADPGYLLRRQLERELERRHPNVFVPRYSMVMFHKIPYQDALSRGAKQADVLRKLTDGISTLEQVDYERAAKWVERELTPV